MAGYAPANDVGLHDFRHADRGAMLRVKGQDGFLPIGPAVTPARDFDPADLHLRTFLNGEVVQEATADDLIWGVAYQLADLSRLITLEPGDVILTGTPANSRPMEPGDVVAVEIDGLGRLENTVVDWDVDLSGAGEQPEVSPATLHVALAIPEDEAERLAAKQDEGADPPARRARAARPARRLVRGPGHRRRRRAARDRAERRGYDFVACLGSRFNPTANPGEPPVSGSLDRMRDAVERDIPVLGLCFGGQVLSAVLGGSVAPTPCPEFGWIEIETDEPGRGPGRPVAGLASLPLLRPARRDGDRPQRERPAGLPPRSSPRHPVPSRVDHRDRQRLGEPRRRRRRPREAPARQRPPPPRTPAACSTAS